MYVRLIGKIRKGSASHCQFLVSQITWAFPCLRVLRRLYCPVMVSAIMPIFMGCLGSSRRPNLYLCWNTHAKHTAFNHHTLNMVEWMFYMHTSNSSFCMTNKMEYLPVLPMVSHQLEPLTSLSLTRIFIVLSQAKNSSW